MSVPGAIVMWGGSKNNIPAGWLVCDGSMVSQTQYPNLWTAVGYNFGQCDQVGQFYLPDLRGRFIRGVDDNAGRDPDVTTRTDMQNPDLLSQAVGSVQSHALQTHSHNYYGVFAGSSNIDDGSHLDTYQNQTMDTLDANTSSETRPINAYLYFIIMT